MLTISSTQRKALSAASAEDFVRRTVAFMKESTPAWSKGRSDHDIAEQVRKTIDACDRIGIRQEINIQKVLYHSIRNDIDPFADGPVRNILTEPGETESIRVIRLIKYLRDNGRH